MRKNFTSFFSLMLLMLCLGAVTAVKAEVNEQTPGCGQTLDESNVELVTSLDQVCDSSTIVFKVVGDFADTTYYAFNYDNNMSGGYTSDPSVSIKEGLNVLIQVMEVSNGDTCYSNTLVFNTNVVDPIEIMEPEEEHPTCGSVYGEVTVNFTGGYTDEYLEDSGIEYPYLYSVVPEADWNGPDYYPDYTTVSPNRAAGAGTYYVAVIENKDTSTVCLTDLMDIASWDTAVINETSPIVLLDTMYTDSIDCYMGGATVSVDVSGGTPASYGLIVSLIDDATGSVVAVDSTVDGTAVFEDITAGTYSATVVDSVGCDAASDDPLVLEEPAAVAFDIAIKSVDCFGGANGEIVAFIDTSVSDAANSYEALLVSLDTTVDNTDYGWQSMDPSDSIVFTGLSPIYYSLFVRDATNGCDSVPYVNPNGSGNVISIQSPGALGFDIVYEFGMDSIPCVGDSILVTLDNLTGGSGEYEASLSIFGGEMITDFSDTMEWYLPVGQYEVSLIDASVGEGACSTDSIFTIVGNDPLGIEYIGTESPLCAGQDDGLLEVEAYGGTGMYLYSIDSIYWKEDNIFNVGAGEYTVYVKDAECEDQIAMGYAEIREDAHVLAVDSFSTLYGDEINEGSTIEGEEDDEFATNYMICNGTSTGSILASVESWTRLQPFAPDNLASTRNIKAYITDDESEVYVSGEEMGRIKPNAAETYFFADELPAGTYFIWAVDTFGCEMDTDIDGTPDYLTFEIIENDPLELFVAVVDSASCAGANDGLISLTKNGGDTTTAYYYGVAETYQQAMLKGVSDLNEWWPEDAEEININVTGGLHYVILYNEGCGTRDVVEVDVAGHDAVTLVEDSIQVTDIVCFGEADGMIEIDTATGGSGELVYTLYEGGMTMADTVEGYVEVSTTQFSNLEAGNYYIEVIDLGPDGCDSYWTSMLTITQPDLDFSIEYYDITCAGNADGKLILTMVGAGEYAPVFKLGTANWKKFDTYDAESDTWTKNVQILEEGDYVVSAIDSLGQLAGCDGMAIPFTVIEPPVLTITAEGNDTTACSAADDGFITVSVEGGKEIVDSFQVALVGVDTALIARDSVLVFQGLEAGEYTLEVTEVDAEVTSACVMTETVTVIPPDEISTEIVEQTETLACKGDSTGFVKLAITGGTGEYVFLLNDELIELEGDSIKGLPAGEYTLVVMDDVEPEMNMTSLSEVEAQIDFCIDTTEFVIEEPDEYLTLTAEKIQDVSCQDSGRFSVQGAGGTPGYKYFAALSTFPEHELLPDPTSAEWQEDSIFAVTEPGTWVVWVMDAAGCIVGGEFDADDNEINEWRVAIGAPEVQITVNAAATAAKCFGDYAMAVVHPDSVVVTEEGTVVDRDYTVWFETLAGDVLAENDTLMIVGDTTVVAWVKDTESGCTGFDTVVFDQPDELVADALVIADGDFTCPDEVEGYMEAMASGGTEPYTYQIWQNGTIKTPAYTEDNSFLAQVGNEYSFVVKDANGCTDTLDVAVPIESADPIVFEIVRELTCADDTAASVEIEVSGEEGRTFQVIWTQVEDGDGSVVYTDSSDWYPAGLIQLDQVFKYDNEDIADKHYDVTIVDNMGCTSDTITVTYDKIASEPVELTVTVGAENECTTDVTITASGGVGGYVYMINDEVVEEGLQLLSGGEYVIYVEDDHGCWDADTITLDYLMTMDTTLYIYTGDTVEFVYGDIDTMLTGEMDMYTFHYDVDTACTAELNVYVEERDRTAPVLDTVSPTDTIADNHPELIIVFEDDVTFNEMGYLWIIAQDSSEESVKVEITADMFSGDSIFVDYDAAVSGGLALNTTYIVKVDSGVVMGDGLVWDGIADDTTWTFTTGVEYLTGIEDGFEAIDYSVYPNPFDSYIRIDNGETLDRVIVSNIAGQRVLDIVNPSNEIETGNLVTGVYVVTLISNNEIVKSERIIKR